MRLNRGKERVLVIPDLQIPFEHPDALAFMAYVAEQYGPTKVVCIGDEVDQMALSRFDPDPDGPNAGAELVKALERIHLWYDVFPDVNVCDSNHTVRVYKQAFMAGIPEAYMREVSEWLEAPEGWSWEKYFEIDGVRYEHGDAQGGMYAAQNLAMKNRQSTVIGHHHNRGGVQYFSNEAELIFGFNVGCLIDVDSVAFKYGRLNPLKPTLGCGVVTEGVPYFVPMLMDDNRRWTGEVVL